MSTDDQNFEKCAKMCASPRSLISQCFHLFCVKPFFPGMVSTVSEDNILNLTIQR